MTRAHSIPRARLWKPLVSGIALLLGLCSTALAMTIQHDPDLFRRPQLLPEFEPEARLQRPALEAPLLELAFVPTVSIDSVVRLDEVLVEGRRLSALAPRVRARAPASLDRVIAAPCNDGEYRRLDPHRGVRLTCPSQPDPARSRR